jgi:membrane-bound ClpP family serine protease
MSNKEKGRKARRTNGNVVVNAVKEEVEHEEEGAVRKPLVDVEDEAVHAVLEKLQNANPIESELAQLAQRKGEQHTVQITFPNKKHAPDLAQAVERGTARSTVCWTRDWRKM